MARFEFAGFILVPVLIKKGPHSRVQVAFRRAGFDGGSIDHYCLIQGDFC